MAEGPEHEAQFAERVVRLLLDLAEGRCGVTDQDVLEASGEMAEILSGVVCLHEDLELSRREREESMVSRDYVRSILDSMAELVLTVDADWNVQLANQAALALLETPHERVTGRPLNDFLDSAEPVFDALRSPDSPAARTNIAVGLRADNGCIIPISLSISDIRDPRGHIVESVITGRDLRQLHELVERAETSAAREAERARDLTRALRDLEHAHRALQHKDRLAALGRFAGGIAHELNSPLTSVVINAEAIDRALNQEAIVADHAGGPDLPERAKALQLAATRCKTLVSQLLGFSRPGVPERQSVDLRTDVVLPVLMVLSASFADDGTESRVLMSDNLCVLGEATTLQQVVTNLLTNAAQAMGGKGTVTIRAWRSGGEVILSVSDQGPGLRTEDPSRLFTPFFTTKGRGEGTGLGLSISERVVADHGGSIRARNHEGGGAEFTVTLPAAEGVGLDAREQPEPSRPPTESAQEPSSAPQARANVLVVDDEEEYVLATIAEAAERQGHSVFRATSGATALALLAKEDIHVMLSDHLMPGMNGLELLEKARVASPGTVGVLMSGNLKAERRQQAMALGVVGFLDKPCSSAELEKVLAMALAHRREQEQNS